MPIVPRDDMEGPKDDVVLWLAHGAIDLFTRVENHVRQVQAERHVAREAVIDVERTFADVHSLLAAEGVDIDKTILKYLPCFGDSCRDENSGHGVISVLAGSGKCRPATGQRVLATLPL